MSYSERFTRYSYFTVQCQIVDKEILRIISNIRIYYSSDKVQYIFENFTVIVSSGTSTTETVNVEHISIFGICVDMRHIARHSSNVTVNSYNSQLTLHTDTHASYSGAVWREGRTILGSKSKLLYSEIALSWKPFGVGHIVVRKISRNVGASYNSKRRKGAQSQVCTEASECWSDL